MIIQPCPVCGQPDCQVGSVKHAIDLFTVYCGTPHCLIGPARSTQVDAANAWNKLSNALALIEDISIHLDSPSWGHELMSADDGLLVECQGQDVLRAMLEDYRNGH